MALLPRVWAACLLAAVMAVMICTPVSARSSLTRRRLSLRSGNDPLPAPYLFEGLSSPFNPTAESGRPRSFDMRVTEEGDVEITYMDIQQTPMPDRRATARAQRYYGYLQVTSPEMRVVKQKNNDVGVTLQVRKFRNSAEPRDGFIVLYLQQYTEFLENFKTIWKVAREIKTPGAALEKVAGVCDPTETNFFGDWYLCTPKDGSDKPWYYNTFTGDAIQEEPSREEPTVPLQPSWYRCNYPESDAESFCSGDEVRETAPVRDVTFQVIPDASCPNQDTLYLTGPVSKTMFDLEEAINEQFLGVNARITDSHNDQPIFQQPFYLIPRVEVKCEPRPQITGSHGFRRTYPAV